MLMSIPLIGALSLYALLELMQAPEDSIINLQSGWIVAILSFVTAYLAIAFFMKLVSRIGMFPFMVYRVVLGILIIAWMLWGQGG